MDSPRHILEHLLERRDLDEAEAARAARAADERRSARPRMAGALLAAVRAKGLTAAEVRGFAARHALARAQARIAAPRPTPSTSSARAATPPGA